MYLSCLIYHVRDSPAPRRRCLGTKSYPLRRVSPRLCPGLVWGELSGARVLLMVPVWAVASIPLESSAPTSSQGQWELQLVREQR